MCGDLKKINERSSGRALGKIFLHTIQMSNVLEPLQIHKLPDSSRLAILPLKGCKTFALQICVRYGSHDVGAADDYELAHFLEHLFAPLPSTRYPSTQINEKEFGYKGIVYNATTSPESTIYEYYGMSEHLDYILKRVLHAYTDFAIDSVFEKEKRAIMNELQGDTGLSGISCCPTDTITSKTR